MTETIKKKDNRGGKREGAGRKPVKHSYSAHKIEELNNRIERRGKKENKHMDDVALDILYDETLPPAARINAYKVLKEYSTIKASEGSEADEVLAPAVYLPNHRPDLKVVDGGK